jgi:hypothetical protein
LGWRGGRDLTTPLPSPLFLFFSPLPSPVVSLFKHNGDYYEAGDMVDLTDEQAVPLLEVGTISELEQDNGSGEDNTETSKDSESTEDNESSNESEETEEEPLRAQDMNADPAIEYIESTPLGKIPEGFMEGEDRTTVVDAWEKKQNESA